jgi:hypothetical protein
MRRLPLAITLLALGSASTHGQAVLRQTPRLTCRECLHLTHVVEIGDDSLGYVNRTRAVIRDHAGGYLVARNTDIVAFTADGKFSRAVGREGSGPGEYRHLITMIAGPGDSITVFDSQLARATILAPDLIPLRAFPTPGQVLDAIALPGSVIVLNAILFSTAYVETPFHILSATRGEIVRSFRSRSGDVFNPWAGWRELTPGVVPGTFWAARRNRYEIQLLDTLGHERDELVREVDWFKPYEDEAVLLLSREHLPVPSVERIHLDRDGRLWVMLTVGDPEWRQHLVPFTLPDGRTLQEPDDVNGVWDTVVEVIDPESRLVLASQRFDMKLLGFLDDRMVFGFGESDGGNPVLHVWLLTGTLPAGW